MAEIVQARVWQKVDTYNNWMANDLILGKGEMALVVGNGGIPLNMRWGDGTKAFRDLPNAIAYDQGQFVAITGTALPAVTGVGYTILGGGTYTQTAGGNVVVPDGKLGVLVSEGGTWSLQSEVELPELEGGVDDWEAKTYKTGEKVIDDGFMWTALEDTSADDKPFYGSSKWKQTLISDLKIDSLQNTLLGVDKQVGKLFNKSTWITNTNQATSAFIVPILEGVTELYISGMTYNVNNNYIAHFSGLPTEDNIIESDLILNANISINLSKLSGFTSETKFVIFNGRTNLINISTNNGLFYRSPIIDSLRVDGYFIDKNTVSESEILREIKSMVISSKNLLSPSAIEEGRINPQTGSLQASPVSSRIRFSVEGLDKFIFSSVTNLNQPAQYHSIAFYIDSTHCIARSSKLSPAEEEINCKVERIENGGFKVLKFPKESNFCVIDLGQGNPETMKLMVEKIDDDGQQPSDYEPYKLAGGTGELESQVMALASSVNAMQAQIDNVKSVPSRWTGCKYVACGDSITAAATSYAVTVSEGLATEIFSNRAVNGMTMGEFEGVNSGSFSKTGGAYAYDSIRWGDFDLVTIALGTNDFNFQSVGIPVGSMSDTTSFTYIGAYKKVLDYIFTQNPLIRVVLLTPLQLGNYDRENSHGNKFIDYANAVKEIAQRYACPVVDGFANSGWNDKTRDVYTTDGIHGTAIGNRFYGEYVLSQIKNM